MSELTERLAEAAVAAIRDVEPAIAAAGPRARMLTVELEIGSRGRVVGAVAWIENRVNIGKLLGVKG